MANGREGKGVRSRYMFMVKYLYISVSVGGTSETLVAAAI